MLISMARLPHTKSPPTHDNRYLQGSCATDCKHLESIQPDHGNIQLATLNDSFSSVSTRVLDLTASLSLATPLPDAINHHPQARLSNQSALAYQIKRNEHEELGCMEFHFDSLQDALDESKTAQRPVLFVQAELPGDVDAGLAVFSHPLIVEASDSFFITVFLKDLDFCGGLRSASGKSPRTCVSFLDDAGNDIAPNLFADLLTLAGMADAMIEGLEIYHQTVPKYLRLPHDEQKARSSWPSVPLPPPCRLWNGRFCLGRSRIRWSGRHYFYPGSFSGAATNSGSELRFGSSLLLLSDSIRAKAQYWRHHLLPVQR